MLNITKEEVLNIYNKLSEKKLLNITSILACKKIHINGYDQQLIKWGKDISGKVIHYVIPKNLGGTDHPANYRLVDVNSHHHWNNKNALSGCDTINTTQCFYAILSSVVCGQFLRE